MNYRKWTIVLIINLCIVAFLGLLMRYKIAFSFPMVEQKHLQHAHSHFAFIAWISQALYLLMIHLVEKYKKIDVKRYNFILVINTIFSYAMMVSFIFKGYHVSSNTFSFLLILNSVLFAYTIIKDLKTIDINNGIKKWFYAAIFFNIISAFGTFALVYMLLNKIYSQQYQLMSVYYYLHFQYNGWFLTACFGLLLYQLSKRMELKHMSTMFWLFCFSVIPNYFLSILWYSIPLWLNIIVIISAFAQVLAWLILLKQMYANKQVFDFKTNRYDFWLSTILISAFTLKLFLQLGSTVPYISQLAYGLRSIVIAYLHLVLLVVISLFLIQYLYKYILIKKVNFAVFVFVFFVLMNEFLLGVQGLAGMFSYAIANIHFYLFYVSIGIFFSIFYLLRNIRLL